jgi:hypothetical protein
MAFRVLLLVVLLGVCGCSCQNGTRLTPVPAPGTTLAPPLPTPVSPGVGP